jgi:hypothetical protein
MPHKVIAECVDRRNGRRHYAGALFEPEPTKDQAARLIKAGAIEEIGEDEAAQLRRATAPADPASIVREQINEDGLFDHTVAELKEIAASEDIDLAGATKKDEIVAAIRAHRAR